MNRSNERIKRNFSYNQTNTIPYKYLVSSEALSFFNSRRIDEEMVIPF
ncbi:protein of unknown function [Shewanella benthica]|uniref:Uncharacterized protein n=1 Tax=Shewanella benthica TaxID=43661 RepID=A0A330M294_9GAMM|nr:protein of unknown function [Shewanella benthica]